MIASIILPIITALWFILSVFLSHQGGEETYSTSMVPAEWLSSLLEKLGAYEDGSILGFADLEFINTLLRRSAHIIIFLVLAALLCTSILILRRFRKSPVPVWSGFAFCLLYAWADEATKIWISGRHFAWEDVGLNVIGCCIGGLVFLLVRWIINKAAVQPCSSE